MVWSGVINFEGYQPGFEDSGSSRWLTGYVQGTGTQTHGQLRRYDYYPDFDASMAIGCFLLAGTQIYHKLRWWAAGPGNSTTVESSGAGREGEFHRS